MKICLKQISEQTKAKFTNITKLVVNRLWWSSPNIHTKTNELKLSFVLFISIFVLYRDSVSCIQTGFKIIM